MSVDDGPAINAVIAEAHRSLAICNACRYCEGYCAVFPALERRLSFDESDVHYLASLCHNCGACLYACQYAPPHEFALNFPRALAEVRRSTYVKYAWPQFFASWFERNGVVAAILTALCIAFFLFFAAWYAAPLTASDRQGAFYAVIPHGVMVGLFGVVFAFAVVALSVALTRFWSDVKDDSADFAQWAPIGAATLDAGTLKYLDGGGDGCTYPQDKPSFARRNLHHLTFYGFLLCFAATVVATIYHYALGRQAPYPFYSAPVMLGTIGGLALLIGTAGLLWLMARRDPDLADVNQSGIDVAFLLLLFITSLTGLLLLGLRDTRMMSVLLAIHLGVVMALFLTLPYGKFVHGFYRFAALARFHIERRRPAIEIGAE